MDRTYDIFEVVDGTAIWQKAVTGHDEAVAIASAFAQLTTNEVLLMHLASNAVIPYAKRPDFRSA
jgi:hypothetical protein